MLLSIPLALPEHLQPGAVQHDMNEPIVPCDARMPSSERTAMTAKRGVIRHAEIQPEQAQDRTCETFGLTQRQMKDEPQRQHRLDRHI